MAFCTDCGAEANATKFCTQCGSPLTPANSDKLRSIPTSFDNQCKILGEIWIDHREDEEFQDFNEYNDISLPLAYMLSKDIVQSTPIAAAFIAESWKLLLAALGAKDQNFQSLAELLESE